MSVHTQSPTGKNDLRKALPRIGIAVIIAILGFLVHDAGSIPGVINGADVTALLAIAVSGLTLRWALLGLTEDR